MMHGAVHAATRYWQVVLVVLTERTHGLCEVIIVLITSLTLTAEHRTSTTSACHYFDNHTQQLLGT